MKPEMCGGIDVLQTEDTKVIRIINHHNVSLLYTLLCLRKIKKRFFTSQVPPKSNTTMNNLINVFICSS